MMGETTGIEWTDASWNPWMGCHKVSQGCKNCYMFREQKQYGNDPNVVRRSKTKFNDPLKWTEPRRIFTCSWSDWFIEEADEWRDEAWDIIRRTPQHTYQILTKRPENIIGRLPSDWVDGYPNVWLGVSAEDQANFDKRIQLFMEVPCAIRFISAEPLLGEIDFFYYRLDLDWIIVGGESGPGYRPMDVEWARWLVRQCQSAEVPVFVKQLGGWPDKRHDMSKWPEDLRVRQFPDGPPIS